MTNRRAVGEVVTAAGERRWNHADHRTPGSDPGSVDRCDAEVVAGAVTQAGGGERPRCRRSRRADIHPPGRRTGRTLEGVPSDCCTVGRRGRPATRLVPIRGMPAGEVLTARSWDLVGDVARRSSARRVLGENSEVVPHAVGQPGHGVRRCRAYPVVDGHPSASAVGRALDHVVTDRRTAGRCWRSPTTRPNGCQESPSASGLLRARCERLRWRWCSMARSRRRSWRGPGSSTWSPRTARSGVARCRVDTVGDRRPPDEPLGERWMM